MRTYAWTFAALLALTAAAFGVSLLSLGPWSPVVTVTIALAKSVLVALFFMHLLEHRVSSRLTLAVAAALAAFLVGFAVLDVGTRDDGGPGGAAGAEAARSPSERRGR